MAGNLLITGFEPFGGRTENLSRDVGREVASLPEFAGSVRFVELPVSFKRASDAIRKAVARYKPDAVLMLGFSSKREKINVERVAINVMDAKIPDNDGVQPVDTPISDNGPAAIFSSLPIKSVLAAIREAGVDAIVSNSAGTFVCNSTFYTALLCAKRRGKHPPVGFIHLPDMDKATAVKAIRMVTELVITQ